MDYIRSKNWQILRTNWYNALEKFLWATDFVKIGYRAPNAQINSSRVAKRALRGSKIRKYAISQQF